MQIYPSGASRGILTFAHLPIVIFATRPNPHRRPATKTRKPPFWAHSRLKMPVFGVRFGAFWDPFWAHSRLEMPNVGVRFGAFWDFPAFAPSFLPFLCSPPYGLLILHRLSVLIYCICHRA